MTQFVPYVPGTPSPQRRNTAALALLENSNSVVVLEQTDSPNVRPSYTKSNVSAKLHAFKQRAEREGVHVTVSTEREGNLVRGFAHKVVPSVAETPTEAKARTATLAKNPKSSTAGYEVGTLFVAPYKTPRVPADAPAPARGPNSPQTRQRTDTAALQRILDADGRKVTLSVYPTESPAKNSFFTLEEQRVKAERRRGQLKRAAKNAGLSVQFTVSTGTKTVNVSGRLLK